MFGRKSRWPDERGRFGPYGGRFVPETLMSPLAELEAAYAAAQADSAFHAELDTLRAQATSSKPKAGIIRESLTTVRHIIEAGAAHLLVTHGPQITALLSTIPH